MNFSQLKSALGIAEAAIAGHKISLSSSTLTENLADLLLYCYDNQPFILTQAVYVSEDETTGTVVVRGASNFQNVADLPTEATFRLDDQGQVQVRFAYTLRGTTPGPADWIFSRSFPTLPKVLDNDYPVYLDYATMEVVKVEVPPLDKLNLFDTSFIVTSAAGHDTATDTDLAWGINFVSKVRPEGIIGVVSSIFQYSTEMKLSGTIVKPLASDNPEALRLRYATAVPKRTYPWEVAADLPKGVPGILLSLDLGLSCTFANNNVTFAAEKCWFYTPLSADWQFEETHPAFTPVQAITGRASLPNAGIEVEMIAELEPGVPEFSMIGRFEGISLGNLAKLSGITGDGSDPLAALPQAIRDMGSALSGLSLTQASFTLDYSDPTDVDVTNITFSIGMPDLRWEIWEDHFTVSDINCFFDITNPFSTTPYNEENEDDDYAREFQVTLYGTLEIEGVPFTVSASNDQGFTVYAEMAESQTIPLAQVLSTYAPGVTPPGDLTVDLFRVGIVPGKSYDMALAMAGGDHPFVIPVGPKSLEVSDVSMGFTYTKGAPLSGSVSGTVDLADYARLSVIYDIPGDVVIQSWIPEIKLRQLLETLTNQGMDIPDAFDLTFTDSSVRMVRQASSNTFQFQLATLLNESALVALQVQQIGGQWGAAAGISLSAGKISDLPGLGTLKQFEDLFSLDKFTLIASSFESPGFQFPDTASFNTPALATGKVALPAQASGVVAGLNAYAQWTINTSDPQQKLLKSFLGLDPVMGVTVQVGKNPSAFSKLFVTYNTTVMGHPLKALVGGQINNGTLSLFMTGMLEVNIMNSLQKFDTTLAFTPTGAFMSATMKGASSVDFSVFKLSNLAVQMGINWAGVPSMGVAATIDVAQFHSSVAVFFDSANPSKSLVAGAISDLTLADVLDTLTGDSLPSDIDTVLEKFALKGTQEFTIAGALASDLDKRELTQVATACKQQGGLTIPTGDGQNLLVVNTPGSQWYLTDITKMRHYSLKKNGSNITVSVLPQFYCAPQATAIGSITFPQGFYVNAALSLYGFDVTATIEINPNKGLSIDAQTDAIVIGNSKVFSLTAAQGTGGPRVSISTFVNPQQKDPLFRNPHCYLNGQLTMLGVQQSVYVNITTAGAEFQLKVDLASVVKGELHGSYTGKTALKAGGMLKAEVGTIDLGLLGKVDIESGAACDMDLYVNGKSVGASVGLAFEYSGQQINLGRVGFNVATQTLADLPAIATDAIKKFFNDTYKDAEKWLEDAGAGVVSGYGTTVSVLKNGYGKTVDEAAALLKGAGKTADAFASDLKNAYGLTEDALASVLKKAGYAADQITKGLKKAFNSSAEAIARVLDKLGTSAEEVANALKSVLSLSNESVANALKNAGYAAERIGDALKKAFGMSAGDATALLKKIGCSPEQVATALKQAYQASEEAVASLLKNAGFSAVDAGKALKAAYGTAADAAAGYLKKVGYEASRVANCLKDAYGVSLDAASNILKNIGFDADNIAKALQLSNFKAGSRAVAAALKYAGFAADQISAALKAVFSIGPKELAKMLEDLGYTAKEVAEVLQKVYAAGAEAALGYLRDAGYYVVDMGEAMDKIYGQSYQQTAQFLKNLGYKAEEIANVMKQVYKQPLEIMGGLLKGLGYNAEQTAKAMYDNFTQSADVIFQHLYNIGFDKLDMGNAMKNICKLDYAQTARLFKNLGYKAEEIASVMKDGFGQGVEIMGGLLKGLGYNAEQTAKAMYDNFTKSADVIFQHLYNIGFDKLDMGNAMKNICKLDYAQTARLFKNLGYRAEEIASVMKDGFGQGIEIMGGLLKGLGYNAEQVAKAMYDNFTQSAKTILQHLYNVGFDKLDMGKAMKNICKQADQATAQLFKNLRYRADEVGDILKSVFSKGVNDASKIMRNIGYSAKEVAGAVKSLWNMSSGAVDSALKYAGYSKDEIQDAFEDLGGDLADYAEDTWGDIEDSKANPSNW